MIEIKAALISLRSRSSEMTKEAMLKYFEHVEDIFIKDIQLTLSGKGIEAVYQGVPIKGYDCVYIKGSFNYDLVQRTISESLSNTSFMPLTSDAFTLGHNEYLTHLALARKAIPIPKTWIATSLKTAKQLLRNIRYPVVLRLTKGTLGKGVMYAESYTSAITLVDAMDVLHQPLVIQEFIETEGKQTRVIVIGGEVFCAYEKKSKDDDTEEVKGIELSPKQRRLAVDAAQAIGAGICGVDMIGDKENPIVITVHLTPNLQAVQAATGHDVADAIAAYLYDGSKHFKEQTDQKLTLLEELGISYSDKTRSKIEGMVTPIDFRGERIILSKLVTEVSELRDQEEVMISVEQGKINVQKL